ncbi:hypothetical protein FJT64_005884 [Amphibalanus amphitrite]|uniref:Uncharacterized protein n=1 Tax=Amphibalanus amphitrite TaxID=1232801 RepID=A0A6A4VJU2_AMPAM|nr:hypothetical protein FJT64_005884 [Amphibalanus amphitrite]
MSFPSRPPYGAGSPTPWSPSAGAGRGSSPGRWTPVGSPRGGAQPWTGAAQTGRPVTPVRSPAGRATPVQMMTPPPPRPAATRSSPARSGTPVAPGRHPPPGGHQGARDGRPMTPQRLFSPSRMMGSPAPQMGRGADEPAATQDVIDKQSQEYVDEKLAEFQAAIHHLQVPDTPWDSERLCPRADGPAAAAARGAPLCGRAGQVGLPTAALFLVASGPAVADDTTGRPPVALSLSGR